MTIHIRIPEYVCEKCETPFMAYSKGLNCPKCGQPEASNGEGYEFIDSQANALLVHKNVYKRFTPPAWHSGSYSENLQYAIFNMFDYQKDNPNQNWEDKIKQTTLLDSEDKPFKNQEYLLNLFNAINEKFQVEEAKRIADQWWRKSINALKRFLRRNS